MKGEYTIEPMGRWCFDYVLNFWLGDRLLSSRWYPNKDAAESARELASAAYKRGWEDCLIASGDIQGEEEPSGRTQDS